MTELGFIPFDNVLSVILTSACTEELLEVIRFIEKQGIKLNILHYGALFNKLSAKGQIEVILDLYDRMSVPPNAVLFTILISACTKRKKWEEGNSIIEDAKKCLITTELATTIINFYAESNPKIALAYFKSLHPNVVNERTIAGVLEACYRMGDHKEAVKVFNNSTFKPNSFIVTPLIKVFLEKSCINEATELLERFKHILDTKGFTVLMKTSIERNFTQFGVLVDEVVRSQCVKRDSIYESSLVSLYFKMGEFVKIEEFIKTKGEKITLEVWNSIISGYSSCNNYQKVDEILSIILNRFEPTMITLLPIVNMYAENGRYDKIQHIIDIMKEYDISLDSSFNNCILKCYLQQGVEKGTNFFDSMEPKDEVSYLIMLDFCSDNGLIEIGSRVHKEISKRKIETIQLMNSLINMYFKCNNIDLALETLNSSQFPKNHVTFNIIISGYLGHGDWEMAFKTFQEMKLSQSKPNTITFLTILDFCSENFTWERTMYFFEMMKNHKFKPTTAHQNCVLKAFVHAKNIEGALKFLDTEMEHPDIISFKILMKACGEMSLITIGTKVFERSKHYYWGLEMQLSALSMFFKLGQFEIAKSILEDLNPVSLSTSQWNVIISGFAQAGFVTETFLYFKKLTESGSVPDEITFLSLLQVCAHRGKVEIGKRIFSYLEFYKIKPTIFHNNCYVDLLARSNHLEEAEIYITNMEKVNVITWSTLLGGCKKHKNVEIGERCFTRIQELDPSDPAHYIMMANLYASVGMTSKANEIRQLMVARGLSKIPGQTYLEVDGVKHSFMVNDINHPDYEMIIKELEKLYEEITLAGYKPNTSVVTKSDLKTEEEKIQSLCGHSEKLAIAYALIKTDPGTPITITKNLRVCIDCHEATKYISKVRNRKITVRDQKVFHVFHDGKCSCGDFW